MEPDRVARLLPTRVLAASSEMWATLAPRVPVSACIVGTPQEQGYPPYRGITDGFLGGSARARARAPADRSNQAGPVAMTLAWRTHFLSSAVVA